MPRLTNDLYLKRHRWLYKLWFDHDGAPFSYLKPNEQWDLHAYYQPYKDLTDEELLEHRKQISKERPSLPARAGKAFTNLATGKQTGVKISHTGKRSISVRAIVRPEIDLKLLSKALIGVAIEMARKEAEQQHTLSKVPRSE